MVGVERFELPTSCSQSLQQGKTGILGNCVFAKFCKNIKQLTYAGCQSEIPLNSSRFRMNRKYCYQSATKISTVILTRVLRSILQEWACGGCLTVKNQWGLLTGDDGAGFSFKARPDLVKRNQVKFFVTW